MLSVLADSYHISSIGTCTPLAVHYIHVLHVHVSIRAGSQYFACVALQPEVNVNVCFNARIEKFSIPVLHCNTTLVQINL